MQIELPDEVIAEAKRLATANEDVATVIVRALEILAWERQDAAAVMEGVKAYGNGNHEPLGDFLARLKKQRGIVPLE